MATRVLYKAADGSWRAAEPRGYIRRLYTLKQCERWALLDNDRVMWFIPTDHPRSYIPMEGLAPSRRANTISAKTTLPRGDRPKAEEPEQSRRRSP